VKVVWEIAGVSLPIPKSPALSLHPLLPTAYCLLFFPSP